MKSYLSIIASLFLTSTIFMPPVVRSETKVIAQNIAPYIKNNIAGEISVKITSADNAGSGVIIARRNNTYLVLTNNHVLRNGNNFTIQTHEGATYSAKLVNDAIQSNDDLALLEFNSDKSYQTATINSAATPKVEQAILVVGYDSATGKLVTQEGIIQQIPDKTFKDGYGIGYSSNILQGMSGGAIFNMDGEVIGINGKTAFPIVNTGYIYRDGTEPTSEEIEQYRQFSWGLSLKSFLAQLNPEIITAYNLPLPETTAEIEPNQLRGWLGELEELAKQITVRIDSSSGENGSGVIVAKENNTYAVLTADHVICEKDKETRECINYTYNLVTPDGKKYPIDVSNINRQEGLDLAVVRFSSNQDYQVAQLANYPLTGDDAVFVAGYPKLSSNTPAQWLFSLGYGLDREQGLIEVNDNSLTSDNFSFIKSQGSLSGGYEMVYTSITYGGMSGGAILDRDGRVIGIHGLAEGEEALDSQTSSVKKIQLGYSLGIPINTFIGLTERFAISTKLPIVENRPKELISTEIKTIQEAILGTKIPRNNTTAERWIERGNQLWRLRRFDEAVLAFDEAIKLKPKFIHLAYYGKGLALFYEGKNEVALENLELATKTQPDFAPAFLYKSHVLQELNRLDKALAAIETASSLQPDNAKLYGYKATILSNLKRYSEAETVYDKAIQLNPRSSLYNDLGLLHYKQEKPDLALANLNKAISLNPNNDTAYTNRANLYSQQNKFALALADLNKAISLNSKNDSAYSQRGFIYFIQGKWNLALTDLNKAIALNPKDARAYNSRGILHSFQEKLNLALIDYNKAIALNPKNASAYQNRANLYSQQKKFALALADLNKAIALSPKDASAYNSRGSFYFDRGKLDLALTDYNKAIQLNPNNAVSYAERGELYHQQGKPNLALTDLNKAIALNPNNDIAYSNRGSFYFDRGKLDLALADYNKAIQLNPNDAVSYGKRGELYHQQGRPDLALADYNKAISFKQNNAHAYYNPKLAQTYINRGNLYQELGQPDLALADYNQAISFNPDDVKAYGNLGLLYIEVGNIEAAIANLQKAQQLSIAQGNSAIAKKIARSLSKLQQQTTTVSSLNQNDPHYNNAEIHFQRGAVYHNQKKWDWAVDEYSKAIELNPSYTIAYLNRGSLYLNQGRLELALADLNKVIDLNPNYAEAYGNLGLLYQKMGNIQAARTNLQKAQQLFTVQERTADAQQAANYLSKLQEQSETILSISPNDLNNDDPKAFYNRGVFYQKQGRLDLALADYNQAISLNPNYAKAYMNRGLVYYNQGKLELALADWNKAIELNPSYTIAYLNRGSLYLNQGKAELALADLNKVIDLNPNLAEAYGNLGLLYQKMGNIQAARTNLQKAQQLFTVQGRMTEAQQIANLLSKLQ